MKWALEEPSFGDIIRVKTGGIYHYGIYASDEEILQFGLNPALRKGIPSSEVEVCASDVEIFLNGEFLEVGVLEKKDGKRYAPQKTVELARARLGEKGYDILYNNCEHFAYECLFGKKISTQTDGVREMFKKLPIVDVYVAEIPAEGKLGKVYPRSRQEEIKAVKNEKVKREKYYVWKLLEYGLYRSFGKKIKDVNFVKQDTGKWTCDGCEFSLSHSHNVVCVALSRAVVGVDVEKIEPTKADIADKVLSEKEKAEYALLSCEEKDGFLIRAWARKESLFKTRNVKALTFEEFKNQEGAVAEKTLNLSDGAYALSVATATPEKLRLYEGIDLLKV